VTIIKQQVEEKQTKIDIEFIFSCTLIVLCFFYILIQHAKPKAVVCEDCQEAKELMADFLNKENPKKIFYVESEEEAQKLVKNLQKDGYVVAVFSKDFNNINADLFYSP